MVEEKDTQTDTERNNVRYLGFNVKCLKRGFPRFASIWTPADCSTPASPLVPRDELCATEEGVRGGEEINSRESKSTLAGKVSCTCK